MKLRIMKCSDTSYWYKDKIGMYFDVLNRGEVAHSVDHESNTIIKSCCIKRGCHHF